MKFHNRQSHQGHSQHSGRAAAHRWLTALAAAVTLALSTAAVAIHPGVWDHTTEADFNKGDTVGVVVTNLGDIKLAAETALVADLPEGSNIVYDMRLTGNGDLYIAAGPEGRLLRMRGGQVEQLASVKGGQIFALDVSVEGSLLVAISGTPSRLALIDGGELRTLVTLPSVRYIWDMAVDGNEVYLATGIEGQLLSVNLREVFAHARAAAGNVGTGGNGGAGNVTAGDGGAAANGEADAKAMLPAGVKVVLDAAQANLLCIDRDSRGRLYVGTDTDGLIYRVALGAAGGPEPFVIFDAPEPEIGAILVTADGTVYAGTADANQAKPGRLEAAAKVESGRPTVDTEPVDVPKPPQPEPNTDAPTDRGANTGRPTDANRTNDNRPDANRDNNTTTAAGDDNGAASNADNGKSSPDAKPTAEQYDKLRAEIRERLSKARETGELQAGRSVTPSRVGAGTSNNTRRNGGSSRSAAKAGNAIYRIDAEGFVSEVFRESVMILRLLADDDALLVATGNEGQLFRVDTSAEETTIVADLEPQQIPALVKDIAGNVLIGTANPASVRRLSGGFAVSGNFTSDVLDASQISLWGKLKVTARIPAGAAIAVQTRSGNVEDPQQAVWSKWSVPRNLVAEPGVDELTPRELSITSPPARFLQYRVTLSGTGAATPVVDRVALAYVVPNIKPAVTSIRATYTKPSGKEDEAAEQVKMQIQWEASDPNKDALLFNLDYQMAGSDKWLPLAADLDKTRHDWDTRRVPDGRYVIRVTASDQPDNPDVMALKSYRQSDPVLIDNTAPAIGERMKKVEDGQAVITTVVTDNLSTIESVKFAVDSTDNWQAVLPDDLIYDSTRESITVKIPGLSPGSHVVTLRATDALGNSHYVAEVIEIR